MKIQASLGVFCSVFNGKRGWQMPTMFPRKESISQDFIIRKQWIQTKAEDRHFYVQEFQFP